MRCLPRRSFGGGRRITRTLLRGLEAAELTFGLLHRSPDGMPREVDVERHLPRWFAREPLELAVLDDDIEGFARFASAVPPG